jgi:hypothetical protein
MKKFLSLIVLMIAFLIATPAHAQNSAFAPYGTASISGTSVGSVLTPSNPNYAVGLGIESSTSHLLLDINGNFNGGIAAVRGAVHNSGGYVIGLQGSAYLKLNGFLIGGGALYSQQVAQGVTIQSTVTGLTTTISNNRNQIRPFVGVGYQFSRDRAILSYVLPGRDVTGSTSSVSDRTVNFSNEIFLGRTGVTSHFRFTQNVSVSTSDTYAQINALGAVSFFRGANIGGGLGLKVTL